VVYEGECPLLVHLLWGEPQGSVLGPLLFVLYTAGSLDLIVAHGVTGHFHADDSQMYVSSPAVDVESTVSQLMTCQQLEKINVADVQFMSANLRPLPSVRNLAVILDNRLSTADQGAYPTAICRACYYQLRQLHNVLHSLTPEAAKTLVHAFINCRLDNCNASLYGIADNQFQRLQSVQNAAVWLVTGSRRSEHITPVLRSLYWLPVRQ